MDGSLLALLRSIGVDRLLILRISGFLEEEEVINAVHNRSIIGGILMKPLFLVIYHTPETSGTEVEDKTIEGPFYNFVEFFNGLDRCITNKRKFSIFIAECVMDQS